jgi:peroxiredoxin Q/BCP
MKVEEGKPAPDFELAASNGKTLSLNHFRNQWIVLYFYPKDDTPGCTVEACEFGKQNSKFQEEGAVILGISPDGIESHDKFIRKFELPFVLLADEGHHVAEKYGVWVEKNNFGKNYWGVQRATVLIDKKGVVKKIWPKVKAEGHAAEVLAEIKAFKS